MMIRFTRNEMMAIKKIAETIDPSTKLHFENAIEGPIKINFDGTFTIKIDPDYITENLELVAKYLPVMKMIATQISTVVEDITDETEKINKKYYPTNNVDRKNLDREIERIQREINENLKENFKK